ncbi:MAG TPA: alpha/beta fold hydrolase [Lacipirellulaceae bacterium]|jgi:pimeloyl-ACP methyl ester carboxylesterase|nr:alpha/beta fold hydrolase [Lacipirellulaceae bacterium]
MAVANTQASMVAVGDTQLQCYETGSGEPVLLVSGWPQSALVWDKLIPLLASDYRVIAVEPPALGSSQCASRRAFPGFTLASVRPSSRAAQNHNTRCRTRRLIPGNFARRFC